MSFRVNQLTGFGAGGSGFNAYDYGSPLVWMDPTFGITTISSAVSAWANRGTHSSNLSQATAGARPSYDAVQQNGVPLLRSTVNTHGLGAGAAISVQNFSMYFAVNITYRAANSNRGLWILVPPSGSDWGEVDGLMFATADNSVTGDMNCTFDSGAGQFAITYPDNNGFSIYELHFNAGTGEIFLDNGSEGTDAYTVTDPIDAVDWGLFGRGNGSGTFLTTSSPGGDWGDFLLYPSVHDATTRAAVYTGLAARYGL